MTEAQVKLLLMLADLVGQLIPKQLEDSDAGDQARRCASALADLEAEVTVEAGL